ncbi:hypothetical protein BKA93DRAFT_754486 [Sparassis latifolia]
MFRTCDMSKNKLQPDRIPTVQEQWDCTKQVLYSHFMVELPVIWLFHPMAEMFGMSTWQLTRRSTGARCKSTSTTSSTNTRRRLGLAAECAHPAEVMILGAGTILGPWGYCYVKRDLHIFTVYHILPFWAGAEHHDFHHMAFTNNFATSFRWCDRLFGTDIKYLEHRPRMNELKMSGLSREQFAATEKKMLEQVEAYRYGSKKVA